MIGTLKQKLIIRATVFALLLTMAAWAAPINVKEVNAASTLKNPKTASEGMVAWDCVTFGSYPQAEVLSSEMAKNYFALEKQLQTKEGTVVSDSVYQALQNASSWDDNGDITLNGTKYRRIRHEDTTGDFQSDIQYLYSQYRWPDTITYHYFQYQPIKWRVLSVNGNQALLLSDLILDDQKYYDNQKGYIEGSENDTLTWERSTVRSWLNGYDAASNKGAMDYRDKNFLGSAFSKQEQDAIAKTSVVNEDNLTYGTEGGKATTDRLFLLSESEVYGKRTAKSYGFTESDDNTKLRAGKSSTYAKAMGVCSVGSLGADYDAKRDAAYIGSGGWWLRSLGDISNCVTYVTNRGSVHKMGCLATDLGGNGVRPALTLNLSSGQWSYAGTTDEKEGASTPQPTITKPVAVSGLTLKAGKKQLTASWKKAASATGYQVAIARDSKFKNGKKLKTLNNKTTKATFSKLKSKTTYYVKVRAYKKSGKTTLYGTYSKVKKVRVK